jgi:hypothetical protein
VRLRHVRWRSGVSIWPKAAISLQKLSKLTGVDVHRYVKNRSAAEEPALLAAFREQLAGLGVSMPPLPDVSHDALVSRALARRQPFDAKGHDGYRDALLWENVKLLAESGPVVLVSNDRKAFAERRTEGWLSDDLAQETGGRCRLATSAEAAIAILGLSQPEAVVAAQRVLDGMPTAVADIVGATEEMSVDVPLPMLAGLGAVAADSGSVGITTEPRNLRVREARRLPDGLIATVVALDALVVVRLRGSMELFEQVRDWPGLGGFNFTYSEDHEVSLECFLRATPTYAVTIDPASRTLGEITREGVLALGQPRVVG